MVGKPIYDELQQKVKESGIIQKSIMHAGFFLVVIVCVFIFPSAYAGKVVVQTDDKYKILILNSYHKEFEWTDGQVSAARETLTTNLTNPELYVEYMDTKRINNEEYLGLLYKTLWLKYRNVKLDAIIATDDNALMFLLEHRNELFGEVPVAFGGINGYSPTLLADRTLFTGVTEVLDIMPTIDLALKLHPDTKKIVVVNDDTPTGKWIRKDLEAAIPHYKGILFEFLLGEEYTTEELLERLRALPKDNIVLTTVWLRDKAKKYISTHDGISLISSNSNVPVYGLFGNHLGNGIIGGKLLDGSIHGKIAAEMVVRILGGESPNDIPVLTESANLFMFDYTQLDRWGISVPDLPEGSTVINMPFSFYEAYKYRIWLAIAIFLLLSALIILLIKNTLKMHRAQKNLRRYETITSIVSDPMSYIDNNYIYITINDAYTRVFNKSREEIVGRSIAEMLGQDVFDDQIKGYIDKCLGGEEVHYHNWFEFPDGKRRYMDMSYYPYFKKGGKVSGVVVNAHNMTERKKAEDALRESEEKFRSFSEQALVGTYLIQGSIFKYVNPKFAEIFGYTVEQCLNDMPFHDLVHPDDKDTVEEQVRRRLSGETKSVHYTFRGIKKSGEIVHVEIYGVSIIFNGKPAAIGTMLDITKRKQTEEALAESESKHRSMMEAIIDPIYICSPDYRVEYMNSAMIERTGHDATGESCFKALHDLDEKCPWCLLHKTQAGDHFTTDIVSPKDNRSYLVSHSPIFHEDGSISKMTVYRDTTDFKKMETQLQQAQKMEAIGTLAGGIAHDFNNILFPIFGYLEMMLADIPEDSPLRGNITEVFNGAKRARDLVQQILTFSRQKDHELKPLKVHLIIKEALKLILSSLPSTIEISQNIQKDCGLVLADPTHIHQVVMNLCTNAYHAMEETGGKLTITLKEVELSAEDLKGPAMIPGPHVCLTVVDTGPGMKQSILDRIFDPYFTTKEEGKGTGLGLAVVHGIVKSHGGQISVYSEPGKGTEFKVHLSVIKKQKETTKVENDTPIQKGDERILLVDDQDLIVQMEKQMLERLGYHVTARISSIDALEAFRANPDKFDIIITDLTMPNMTGDELAGELIKIRSDIPVILCTGFSERMSKEKAAALGIKGYLMKPVVMKELSKIIRDVLDNK